MTPTIPSLNLMTPEDRDILHSGDAASRISMWASDWAAWDATLFAWSRGQTVVEKVTRDVYLEGADS